ncbi:phage tail protein I [Geodermatophilus sp. SYSU D00703]
MRGLVPDLATPFPLGRTLPGLYQGDEFTQEMCAGLDEVLAPVVADLDCLPAYLDPTTTPLDLLHWLAGWVGVDPKDVPAERRRDLVRSAAGLHRRRGTARGLREAVRVWFGVDPEVQESGGADWSGEAGAPLPGSAAPFLVVRLRVPDPATVDVRRLDALVAAVKPAHVPHEVEVLAVG